jgi:aryl-alcohol dehydrogenase-like predicted oxidoreductase
MRTRRLGRVGLEISELALGTWGLSGEAYGPVYAAEVDRVIDKAVELGITLFETADAYGKGEMEKKLGERLDARTSCVVTKLGIVRDGDAPRKRFDAETLRVAFERSRERLRREPMDVVLMHCPSRRAVEEGDGVAFLQGLVKSGALRAWGVSAGSVEVARAALARRAEVLELAYNPFVARDLHALSDEAGSADVGVLARSVLAHGLLAGFWSRAKTFFDHDHRSKRWTKEELEHRLEQLPALRHLVGGGVPTLRAAALRFVLSNALVSAAVLGPRTNVQLVQLVHEAGDGPPYLDEALLAELPERLAAVGLRA